MRYDNVSMTNSRAAHAPGSADPASAGQQSGMAELPRARSSVPAPAPLPKRCAQCGARYPADFRVCPRDALELEDAPAADDPLLGQTLCGTYRLVRIIGEGGMGRVYEAQNSRLSAKRYALKLLHAELARKSEVVARFQREAEAVSGLIHPNVVAVHDVNFTNDGRPFIVAELLEGEDLGSLLDRVGKLASSQAVEIVRRVCDGLAAAHARGIVHRDMKPENVFLSGNSSALTVKILDFGISKLAEDSQQLTRTGVVLGTPAYMAPEQARGDRVDERADIYSVGAILYRAVTGRKPFEAVDAMATLTAVLCEEPPRPRALEPSVSAELELVIQRAMAKQPHERYAKLTDLEAELAALEGGATAVRAPLDLPIQAVVEVSAPANTSDPTARTVLAPGTSPSADALTLRARAAQFARPALVVQTFFGFAFVLAGLADVLAAALCMSAEGKTKLSLAEAALVIIGAAAALVTPLALFVRHLKKSVWTNSPRALELSRRMRRTLLLGAGAYGASALFVHVLETIVRRDAAGLAWPGFAIATFCVATSVSAASWFGPMLLRRNPEAQKASQIRAA
jgi:serine/threonine-protein kinase